jgi:hypothetical protein
MQYAAAILLGVVMSKAAEVPVLRIRERLVPRGRAHLAPPPEENPDDLLNDKTEDTCTPINPNPLSYEWGKKLTRSTSNSDSANDAKSFLLNSSP